MAVAEHPPDTFNAQTRETLDDLFRSATTDPWGIDWRGSQLERRRILIEVLRREIGHVDRVLDLGCAAGDVTSDIVHAVRASSTHALDISREAIALAWKRHGYLRIQFEGGNVLDPGPWHAPVDLVTAILVFEYLDDATLQRWLHMLRSGPLADGGRLVMQRAVRPGNPLGIDETVLDEHMTRGGFRRLVRVPMYGRLANHDRRPVGWLTPRATGWRPLAGRLLRPMVASRRATQIAHALGRTLLGPRAVDLVTSIYAPV